MIKQDNLSRNSHHLDFGAGREVRNPFNANQVFSADVRAYGAEDDSKHFIIEPGKPLPFRDNTFTSVSAYDVLEHLERSGQYGNLFIWAMNEIHRILVPGGLALFVFPALPNLEVYSDPTHVNIIHKNTLDFFTNNTPENNYEGIQTRYEVIRNSKLRSFKRLVDTPRMSNQVENLSLRRKLSLTKRTFLRFVRPSHRIWILRKF